MDSGVIFCCSVLCVPDGDFHYLVSVSIWYPVNSGSGQIADSTFPPLSGSGQTLKIPIQYIPKINYKIIHIVSPVFAGN